jgi:hypothetical protein
MNTTPLTDRSGNKIGSIHESNNQRTLYDRGGNKLGHYDCRTNITYDRSGNKIGNGDLLSTLLNR